VGTLPLRRLVLLTVIPLFIALPDALAADPGLLDQGFGEMYNQEFAKAHTSFAELEKLRPGDPMGPVSDAAAYLFSELDRLHVLQSEFFTDDSGFLDRQRALAPDPAAQRAFEEALRRGDKLASATLAQSPKDENALFAAVLVHGLRSDYLSLIEKKNLPALSEAKQARKEAQTLLQAHPECYDANVAVGVENYLLSVKPLPLRWLLRLGGAQTDKQTGIERLRITAEKGRLLRPFARLLLAVAALRDKDTETARRMLTWLTSKFPKNDLYRQELLRLGSVQTR
jgi:hypothetical protein